MVMAFRDRFHLHSLTTQNETSRRVHPNNNQSNVAVEFSNTTTAIIATRPLLAIMNQSITLSPPNKNNTNNPPGSDLSSNASLAFDSSSPQSQHGQISTRPRNINVVMMGDSLMRYQYLSLAYFLRWGQWYVPNNTRVDNLMVEKSWRFTPAETTTSNNNNISVVGQWNSFFYHSNRLLRPFEICDCFRADRSYSNMFENRYYYDPIYNNTLVYIQAFGNFTKIHGRIPHATDILGRKANQTAWDEYQRPLAGTWDSPQVWEYPEWHDVVRYYLAPLQSDFIVFNTGWWTSQFGIVDEHNSASSLLKQTFTELMNHHSNTRGIWRTTTYPPVHGRKQWGSNASAVDHNMCQAPLWCLNVSWTQYLSRRFSKDGVHFCEPVYRVINEAMLELMGYVPMTTTSNGTGDFQLQRFEELSVNMV
jgi:hypothetical protein